jgi:hypothetical protein
LLSLIVEEEVYSIPQYEPIDILCNTLAGEEGNNDSPIRLYAIERGLFWKFASDGRFSIAHRRESDRCV